ncbi:pyrroline-5-carboxylate reductase [Methanosarcinaceae archaeon]|nr:pyrroline-5-carboxylate reductase [Methanosarcinaceae archaeon]
MSDDFTSADPENVPEATEKNLVSGSALPGIKISVIGAGNIGTSLIEGLISSGKIRPDQLIATRRDPEKLDELRIFGIYATEDNVEAVRQSNIVILAVRPFEAGNVLAQIRSYLIPGKHILISLVADLTLDEITREVPDIPVFRALPNIAMNIGLSMTIMASSPRNTVKEIAVARFLFNCVGKTLLFSEDRMDAACVLSSCGVAFALRYLRAGVEAGVQIGISPEIATQLIAQAMTGAAALVLDGKSHPEAEIDRVTTPGGITIAGLNEMEMNGFSQAVIRGVLKADEAFRKE